jgi:hypothetical protein
VKSLYKVCVALGLFAPAKIFACAACYSNGAAINDPMVAGMNWAIFALGLVVATVLGTFLAYFIYIMRKSETLEAAAQQKSVQNPSKHSSKIGINSPEPVKV